MIPVTQTVSVTTVEPETEATAAGQPHGRPTKQPHTKRTPRPKPTPPSKRTVSTTPAFHTTPSPCSDKNRNCLAWASKGRCFYKHIQKTCPTSCNLTCDQPLPNGKPYSYSILMATVSPRLITIINQLILIAKNDSDNNQLIIHNP